MPPHNDQADCKVSLPMRLKTVIRILLQLRRPDFQAAGHFMQLQWGDLWGPLRWMNIFCWDTQYLSGLHSEPGAAAPYIRAAFRESNSSVTIDVHVGS